jgi:hypothetical protein
MYKEKEDEEEEEEEEDESFVLKLLKDEEEIRLY